MNSSFYFLNLWKLTLVSQISISEMTKLMELSSPSEFSMFNIQLFREKQITYQKGIIFTKNTCATIIGTPEMIVNIMQLNHVSHLSCTFFELIGVCRSFHAVIHDFLITCSTNMRPIIVDGIAHGKVPKKKKKNPTAVEF